MTNIGMFRLFFMNFIFLFSLVYGYSQDPQTMGKINIASPNAASLGKYGDIPVSYHTGIPNISIPIYTVSSGTLSLPISLSYHASGLKVEENDSWVGAGWTLNAGGVITRTVQDKPDERQTSSPQQLYGHYSDYGMASFYPRSGPMDASVFDTEPDLFFFNFNGYSGKFWFNDDRTPMIIPEQDFKIECSYTPGAWNDSPGAWNGSGRCIESFIITTPDGTKYYFGIPQTPVQSPYCDPIEVTAPFTAGGGTSYSQVISSWFLNKIVSVDGNYSIALNYKRDKFAFYTFTNPPTATFSIGNGTDYKYSLVKNLMAGVLLSQITTSNIKVDFVPGAARQDLSRWQTGIDENMTDNINQTSPTLGGINLSDVTGNCFKKFNFSYDYFSDNTTPDNSYFPGIISDKKRLKLLSLQESAGDGSLANPPYKFDYFTEQVPRKLNFSRDHWGYNNGVTTNTQLYPALSDNNGVFNAAANLGIANRESAWPAMRCGTLSKITYPTGGNTSFVFEPNTFTVNSTVNGQMVSTDAIVGGLRIKSISTFDPISNKTNTTDYSYVAQGTNLSSGVLYSKPTYIQVFRNDLTMKMFNLLGNPNGNGCWDNYDANYITGRPYIFSDNPIRPMETTQGYHIGYGEVKVSQNNNGFSVYRYSVTPPWQVDHSGVAITHIANPSTCDASIPNYPAAPLPYDFHRGELTYEGNFKENGAVTSEKFFQTAYEENPVTTPGRCTYSFATDRSFTVETYYELKTARKTESTVIEKQYQGSSFIQKQVQTFYASNYHHEATKIVTTDSKGLSIEKRIKYAFDYRVPVFENISNCYTGAASFLSYFNSLFYSGGYSAQFSSCPGYTSSCFGTTLQAFYTTLFDARKSYIDCRKANFTGTETLPTYQVNHNTAKANANSDLKSLLWMQDNYMNAPIETSEWKNNQLLGATYVQYSNNRGDAYGVYPEKSFKIDLQTPSPTFTSSTVASNNISITKDSRYTDLTTYDFNKGNLISSTGRDSIPVSYDWAYNQNLPVVKISNAVNNVKEKIQPGVVTDAFNFPLGSGYPVSPGINIIINQTQVGSITISLPSLGGINAQVIASFTLTGPSNKTGYLCNSGLGGASCSTTPSSITYSNMPAGHYTLTPTISTSFDSYHFDYFLSYTYQGQVLGSSGLKEFFYEGFEESPGGNIVSGNSHSGTKYLNANYAVPFTIPNNRNYIVQWWNLSAGKWKFNEQAYSNNLSLTGPIDDVRVFPKDALMNSFTYKPPIGITSETDPSGKTNIYEYDTFGRLQDIKDPDGNIIKTFEYHYQQNTQ